jgi:hypothetical protein
VWESSKRKKSKKFRELLFHSLVNACVSVWALLLTFFSAEVVVVLVFFCCYLILFFQSITNNPKACVQHPTWHSLFSFFGDLIVRCCCCCCRRHSAFVGAVFELFLIDPHFIFRGCCINFYFFRLLLLLHCGCVCLVCVNWTVVKRRAQLVEFFFSFLNAPCKETKTTHDLSTRSPLRCLLVSIISIDILLPIYTLCFCLLIDFSNVFPIHSILIRSQKKKEKNINNNNNKPHPPNQPTTPTRPREIYLHV